MTKWNRAEIHIRHDAEKLPIPIISDAAVATRGTADGRMIPVLIMDTTHRPDVEDMIRAHRYIPNGDVQSSWSKCSRFIDSKIRLILESIAPSRCVLIFEFDIARKGGVVDQIIQAQGVYIQPGREGDRLINTINHDRILVEVPSRVFRKQWDKMLYKAMVKRFKRDGLSRTDAKIATENFIKDWRKFGATRVWPF